MILPLARRAAPCQLNNSHQGRFGGWCTTLAVSAHVPTPSRRRQGRGPSHSPGSVGCATVIAVQLAVADGPGGEARFALHLRHLHPDREFAKEALTRDAVAIVMALDGHFDARFVLQYVARPGAVPGVGKLDVDVIVALSGAGGAAPSLEGASELADDLVDIVSAPPLRWSLEAVADPTQLTRILDPIEPSYLAEVARREEPAGPIRWPFSEAGFQSAGGPAKADRPLWSMWTLGPATTDMRRLASVLLAQEAPVCLRVILHPSRLTDDEREGIEALRRASIGAIPDEGLLPASLHTIEALSYLRPVFEVRCLLASPSPISRSMLSAVGHTASEPAKHGQQSNVLEGGFAVVRGGVDVEPEVLRESYQGLALGQPIPSLAAPGLERLRRLLGPWEAANLFRLPVTERDNFPGIKAIDTPALLPPLGDLSDEGRRLGRLVTHGQGQVLIKPEERFRHTYISGQTGTGKSTLLLNLALQDVASGAGVAVIDPHGDLVETILRNIPEERLNDVILVDPAAPVAVVGVNLLEAETQVQREYVVSELCSMMYQLYDPGHTGIIGPRWETMMRQAANLLLAHPEQPSTFLDVSTMYVDPAVRNHLVGGLTDPVLREYWVGEMSMQRGQEWGEIVGWFRSKFEIFRTSRLVRNVVGQAKSTISFTDILNEQRILLVNLSKGLLGQYNSALIGYIVLTKLWAAALERASIPAAQRKDFFIYIDEFQNMTSESLPDMLSEARKFRIGITLANQFFSQIQPSTRDAIMGNVSNRLTFRVGPKDAVEFAHWLGREVHGDDLQTLPNHVAIAAISDNGVPLDPFVVRTERPRDSNDDSRAADARNRSREVWARPVEELDPEFFQRWAHIEGSISSKTPTPTAASNPTPARGKPGAFLDEWLAKRQANPPKPVVDGDPERPPPRPVVPSAPLWIVVDPESEAKPSTQYRPVAVRLSGPIDGHKTMVVRVLADCVPGMTKSKATSLVTQIPAGLVIDDATVGVAHAIAAGVGSFGISVEMNDDADPFDD